ncbi:hypothetical protein BH18ACT1_BH18ACT1_13070 [soil metagenome]
MSLGATSTRQLEYTEHELLESHRFAEPLRAGTVRCHGGFDDDGRYVSPRTRQRVPAIRAWQAQRAEDFATPLLDMPLDRWPAHFPNVAQAKFLLAAGVPGPIISTLTRIGTVEGFGSMIRYSAIPDLQRCFDEDVRGTAMAHLGTGLYEAHARDEAGLEDEGGHKDMWFAARDVAFEARPPRTRLERVLARMGFGGGAPGGAAPPRLLPEDIDGDLEVLIARMARLLLIEISAFHTFAWAEEVLSDPDLVAGEGEAARLVSYIRADETPHVEYLKTTLTEMRDRTFVGDTGRRHAGADLIGGLWERFVAESLGARHETNREVAVAEVEHALDGHPRKDDLSAEFHSLGDQSEAVA